VPLVLLGRGFPAGRYAARVSPADIAPTLAHTVGLVLPGVEGRVVPLPAHTPQ
jgi:glyoxylase-like metal-dependent hydrolase (beta-lactamase superfamily II)